MLFVCKLYINLKYDNFLVWHVINLLQYLIIIHLTRKLSGISPVSPYTIFMYVNLFKDNTY